MKFSTTQQGAVSVIALDGNLMGGPDATALNDRLHEMLEAGKKQIVIDLKNVGFMNSSGLGILIGGAGMLKGAGGGLRLANASPKIASLITIARLGQVLETYPSVQEAVSSFKN